MRLAPFEENLPEGFSLAYLPDSPIIKLRLDGVPDDRFSTIEEVLAQRISDLMIGRGEKTIGQLVVESLKTLGKTMATAESCTGGNIAHLVTSVPGSSDIFNGGVVSYANSAKINVLGVMKTTPRVRSTSSQAPFTSSVTSAKSESFLKPVRNSNSAKTFRLHGSLTFPKLSTGTAVYIRRPNVPMFRRLRWLPNILKPFILMS